MFPCVLPWHKHNSHRSGYRRENSHRNLFRVPVSLARLDSFSLCERAQDYPLPSSFLELYDCGRTPHPPFLCGGESRYAVRYMVSTNKEKGNRLHSYLDNFLRDFSPFTQSFCFVLTAAKSHLKTTPLTYS